MRYKRILMSPFMFTYLLTEGTIKAKCVKGLPEGAKFIRLVHEGSDTYLHAIFEHESFEKLKDGDLIPIIETQFEKL